MNNPNIQKFTSAVSFTKMPDGSCKAVKLEQTPIGYKLVWKRTVEDDRLPEVLGKGASRGKIRRVLGIDPAGVAFYNIEIPEVADGQFDSVSGLIRKDGRTPTKLGSEFLCAMFS